MIEELFHYYRKGTRPFQSLSALPEDQAKAIMEALYLPGSLLWQRFGAPLEYLRWRRRVEHQLHRQFLEKGGRPRQDYPVYFVVGRPKWAIASSEAATMEETGEIQVPLSVFDEQEISFTYPDSMLSDTMVSKKGHPEYDPEYHGRLFTLTEMEKLICRKSLPVGGWHPDLPAALAHYIEMQVWNQTVLDDYLISICWDRSLGARSSVPTNGRSSTCGCIAGAAGTGLPR